MVVPARVVELDEPHVPLGQPAGQQAVRRERPGRLRVRAVQVEHVLRLLRRGPSPPARSSASGRPSRTGRPGRRSPGRPRSSAWRACSSASRSSIFRRDSRGHAVRVVEVQHRVLAGCGTARPGAGSAGSRCPTAGRTAPARSGPSRSSTTNAGRFSFSAAQAVAQPRPHARPAGELVAGLEERDRRVVVDVPRCSTDLTKHRSSAIFAVFGSRSLTDAPDLPCLANLKIDPASGSVGLVGGHAGEPLAHADALGQVLAVQLVEQSACGRTGRAGSARRP